MLGQEVRESKHVYFSKMAELVSTQSTCNRRRVGCVLVDSVGHVISTGYNGVASGLPHCCTIQCTTETCKAVHAEANALLQSDNRIYQKKFTCYTSTQPCENCLKLLTNTKCNRIVFSETYSITDERVREYGWEIIPDSLDCTKPLSQMKRINRKSRNLILNTYEDQGFWEEVDRRHLEMYPDMIIGDGISDEWFGSGK